MPLSTQSGWRWCNKCKGLFFAGNPDRGPAQPEASMPAAQPLTPCNTIPADSSTPMRRAPPGFRLAGAGAKSARGCFCPRLPRGEPVPPEVFMMAARATPTSCRPVLPPPGMQMGWQFCQKCQGLFLPDNIDQGACPAGGKHDGSGSLGYDLQVDQTGLT